MRTKIIIEDGRVTIEYEDGRAVVVKPDNSQVDVNQNPPDLNIAKQDVNENDSSKPVKNCVICEKPFEPRSKRALTCSAECRKEKQRRYALEYNKGTVQSKDTGRKKETIDWCKYCSAWTTHDSKNHPGETKPVKPVITPPPRISQRAGVHARPRERQVRNRDLATETDSTWFSRLWEGRA